MSTLWKISCLEYQYPGMWQRWYKNQCVAAGWPSNWGFKLHGKSKGGKSWSTARNRLVAMEVGDFVVVTLRGNRVGRIGQITDKFVEDEQWNPLVPNGPGLPHGEMGRRVQVRWDLTVGPGNPDLVVQLPSGSTFTLGELRPAIAQVKSMTIEDLKNTMDEPSNWVSLLGNFRYEKALSDYIANYPNHLEDGLLPHPNSKIREKVFQDKTRLDVLLIDKSNKPVIVECKQHSPTVHDIAQLRHYMSLFYAETGELPRGMLVHGGATKVTQDVSAEAGKNPGVEIISYSLVVNFQSSFVQS